MFSLTVLDEEISEIYANPCWWKEDMSERKLSAIFKGNIAEISLSPIPLHLMATNVDHFSVVRMLFHKSRTWNPAFNTSM